MSKKKDYKMLMILLSLLIPEVKRRAKEESDASLDITSVGAGNLVKISKQIDPDTLSSVVFMRKGAKGKTIRTPVAGIHIDKSKRRYRNRG